MIKPPFFKKIPPEDTARNLACYRGKIIITKGRLILAIESGEWTIQSAPFIVVDYQKANILCRNILSIIGIKSIQEKPQHKQVLTITEENTLHPVMKQWVKDNFENLCVRIGKTKNLVMKTQFIPDVTPIQQKGRRIPTHLQERVEKELNKLIDQKNIIKLEKCSDKQIIVRS